MAEPPTKIRKQPPGEPPPWNAEENYANPPTTDFKNFYLRDDPDGSQFRKLIENSGALTPLKNIAVAMRHMKERAFRMINDKTLLMGIIERLIPESRSVFRSENALREWRANDRMSPGAPFSSPYNQIPNVSYPI